jgi:hypothetical protein
MRVHLSQNSNLIEFHSNEEAGSKTHPVARGSLARISPVSGILQGDPSPNGTGGAPMTLRELINQIALGLTLPPSLLQRADQVIE